MCFFFVAGLGAELYYIRDGVLNQYALKFNVPIPANVSDLNFTWRSLAPRTVSLVFLISRAAPEIYSSNSPPHVVPYQPSTKRAHSYSEGGLITKHATAVLLFVCGQKRTHFDRNLFDMRPGIEFLRRQFILMQLSDTLVGPRTFLL